MANPYIELYKKKEKEKQSSQQTSQQTTQTQKQTQSTTGNPYIDLYNQKQQQSQPSQQQQTKPQQQVQQQPKPPVSPSAAPGVFGQQKQTQRSKRADEVLADVASGSLRNTPRPVTYKQSNTNPQMQEGVTVNPHRGINFATRNESTTTSNFYDRVSLAARGKTNALSDSIAKEKENKKIEIDPTVLNYRAAERRKREAENEFNRLKDGVKLPDGTTVLKDGTVLKPGEQETKLAQAQKAVDISVQQSRNFFGNLTKEQQNVETNPLGVVLKTGTHKGLAQAGYTSSGIFEAVLGKHGIIGTLLESAGGMFGDGINNLLQRDLINSEYIRSGDWNPVTKMHTKNTATMQAVNRYATKQAAGNKTVQQAIDVDAGVVQMLPLFYLQAYTGATGAGAATPGAAGTTQGLQYVANLNTASTTLQQSNIMFRHATSMMARDPASQFTFSQSFGNSYNEAKQDGADNPHAIVYALLNATINTAVEMGGGIETLPAEMQAAAAAGRSGLRQMADAVCDEMKEEVVQGFFERGLKAVYDQVEIASMTNPDAMINPNVMIQEAAMAAIGTVAQIPVQRGIGRVVGNIMMRGEIAASKQEQAVFQKLDSAAKTDEANNNDNATMAALQSIFASKEESAAFERLYKTDVVTALREFAANAETVAPETVQEAVGGPQIAWDTETPPAPVEAPQTAPVQLNSQPNAQVTNPQASGMMQEGQQAPTNVAAQQQEGVTDGTSVVQPETAGRQSEGSVVRPGGPENSEGPGAGQQRGNVSVDGGGNRQEGSKAQSTSSRAEHAQRTRDVIEKHAKGKSADVFEDVGFSLMLTDAGIAAREEAEKLGLSPEQVESFVNDAVVGSLIEDTLSGIQSGNGQANIDYFVQKLIDSGVDEAAAKNIASELFDGVQAEPEATGEAESAKEAEQSKKEDEPKKPALEVGNQPKPSLQGRVEVTEIDGRKVATVRKDGEGNADTIGKDVDTVHIEQKYKRKVEDSRVYSNSETGLTVYQTGNQDVYTVVNKQGAVIGTATSLEQARSMAKGKGEWWNVSRFSIGGNMVYWDGAQIKADTDTAFSSPELLVSLGRSQASDDLNAELLSHMRGGFSGATSTDVIILNVSEQDFLQQEAYKGSRAKKNQGKLAYKQMMDAILVGTKDKYGNWIYKPGVTGKNGKHYVFAGQTSSMRKNGYVIMMEESKYNALRGRMLGGLPASKIEKFNPAKYLTNQGTYWTPSEANTGIKGKDIIVVADVYKMIHNVTRHFLRTTDRQSDIKTLMADGFSKEEATNIVNSREVGSAALIMGDLITKATDGTGFVNSQLKRDMQIRGLGGIKGFLQQCDFNTWLESIIPVSDQAFVWTDDSGKVSGGIRRTSEESGVEIMNRWGKWQKVRDAKAIFFESMVKFAGEYTVYKDVNGEQVVDPEASTKRFYDAVGDSDLRSISFESAFGSSDADIGRVKGYKSHSMAQFLRSQEKLPTDLLQAIIHDNVTDPITYMMQDEDHMAAALGVDLDSPTPPASSDVRAQIAWFFGRKFFKTKLARKWVFEMAYDIAKDARGGKLMLKNDEHAYQWVAPDPFGVVNAMTSLISQADEAALGSAKYSKADENNPLSGYVGLKRGQVSTSKLNAGVTALGRWPNIETNDLQVRTNERNERYEELREKYGFGDDALYISLNDELPLNLDNDYDGDTVMAAQGALAKAIQYLKRDAGKTATGSKAGALFTEITHGAAEKADTKDVDFILNSVKLALDADNIGKYDHYVDYLAAMSNSMLKDAASKEGLTVREFRNRLMMNFAAAYKVSFDYAKTGKMDKDFMNCVRDYMKQMGDIARAHGFYVDDAGLDAEGITDRFVRFFPVPEYWEFHPKLDKRNKYKEALKAELSRDGKGKRIMRGADNIMGQLYNDNLLRQFTGNEKRVDKDSYQDRMRFMEQAFPGDYDVTNLLGLSTIAASAYRNVDLNIFSKLALVYQAVNRVEGQDPDARSRIMNGLYKTLGLNPEQFQSVMTVALSQLGTLDKYAGWMGLLNFDQHVDGETSVSEIFKRNARILGSLNKIGEMMNALRQDMYDASSRVQKTSETIHQIKANTAEMVDLYRQNDALLDEISREVAWLDNMFKRLKFSEETFKNNVASRESIAALMGERDNLNRFQEKMKELEAKLDAQTEQLMNSYSLREDLQQKIKESYNELKVALSHHATTAETVNEILETLYDEYESWSSRYEKAAAKAEYYGIQDEGATGLEDARTQEILSAKLDNFLVENGIDLPSDVASETFLKMVNKLDNLDVIEGDRFDVFRKRQQVEEQKKPEGKKPPERESEQPKQPPKQQPPKEEQNPPAQPPKAEEATAPDAEEKAPEKAEPLPVPEAKAKEPTAEEKKLHATYGDMLGPMQNAANSVAENFGKGAQNIIPDELKDSLGTAFGPARHDAFEFGKALLEAAYTTDNGESLRNFAMTLPRRVAQSGVLQLMLGTDANTSNVMKMAAKLAMADDANFKYAAVDFLNMVAREAAELQNNIKTRSIWDSKKSDKKRPLNAMMSADSAIGKAASLFFGYQLDTINVLEDLDNFDKWGGDNSPGYQLVDKILNNVYAAQTVKGDALGDVINATKAFNKSKAANKTVEFSWITDKQKVSKTVSMAMAIDLLHTMETLERSKVDGYSGVYYNLDDGGFKIPSREAFTSISKVLREAINNDADAKAYYEAFTKAYEQYPDLLRSAVDAASGRKMGKYAKDYYPLLFGKPGQAADAKDFDFGLDMTGMTHKRTRPVGSSVVITDPSVRFNAYAESAFKMIARAEVGATMERLNRKVDGRFEGFPPSITDIVTERRGKAQADVINRFIEITSDFRNREDAASTLAKSLRITMQRGILGGHFGSMFKQAASAWNAVGILDFDSVMIGLMHVVAHDKANRRAAQISAIKTRRMGNIDPSISETFNFKGFAKALGKLATDGFSVMDSATIRAIYLASEYQAKKDGFTPGTDEFENAVMSYFKPAYLQTQPQYEAMLRPYLQNSSSEFVKSFGAFKTQPLRNLNTLIRASNEAATAKQLYGKNSEQFKDAKRVMRGTIPGMVTSALTLGVIDALVRLATHKLKSLWKKDDDEETKRMKLLARVMMSASENLAGTTMYGDAIAKLLIDTISRGETNEFYDISTGILENVVKTANDIADAVKTTAKGDADLTTWKNAVMDAATVRGIPLRNAYTWLNGLVMWGLDIAGVNDQQADDILRMIDDKYLKPYRVKDDSAASTRGKVEVRKAIRELNRGRANKVATILGGLDEDDPDIIKGAKQQLKESFIAGEIDAKTYRDWLRKYFGASSQDIVKAVRAAEGDIEFAKREESAIAQVGKDAYASFTTSMKKLNGTTDPNGDKRFNLISGLKLSDSDTDAYVHQFMGSDYSDNYDALRDIGIKPKRAHAMLTSIDTNKNGGTSQEEVYEWLLQNEQDTRVAKALWSANEWSTSLDKYAESYAKNPVNILVSFGMDKKDATRAMKSMDSDSNGSLKLEEFFTYLKAHPDQEEALKAVFAVKFPTSNYDKNKRKYS